MNVFSFRSYNDICMNVYKRLHFLLHEVAPASSNPFSSSSLKQSIEARLRWRKVRRHFSRIGCKKSDEMKSGQEIVFSEEPRDDTVRCVVEKCVQDVVEKCVQDVVAALGEDVEVSNCKVRALKAVLLIYILGKFSFLRFVAICFNTVSYFEQVTEILTLVAWI